jgi:hypothetical protein
MKKFVLLLVVLATAGLAGAEMLVNPGFENLNGGVATGWGGWGSGSGSGWAGYQWYSGPPSWINDGTAYEGDIYMENHAMDASYSSWWGWGWNAAWQSARMPATEGVEYALSAYVRNGAGDGLVGDPCNPVEGPAILKLEWYDSTGAMIDNPRALYDMDNDWSLISFTATAPEGMDVATMQVVVGTEWNGVYVDWDDCSLDMAKSNYAKYPEPEDEATIVPPAIVLVWEAPRLLESPTYNVYFGTESGNLQQVSSGQTQTSFDPCGTEDINERTVYYWRVDSIDDNGGDPIIYTGPEWNFTTLTRPADCPEVDLTDDYMLNMDDLLIMAVQWLDGPGTLADLVGEDGVNLGDFAVLAENWLLGAGGPVIISEFAASNSILEDEDGDSSDWIELYNPTDTMVDLSGWYLTDNADNLNKWEFPEGISLQPDEYLVVFASDKNRKNDLEHLHTNFNLDPDGEYLALIQADGVTIAREYQNTSRQRKDVSYGLYSNREFYFSTPTPGTANSDDTYQGLVEKVDFSVERGFYESSFDVTLNCDTPGSTVYYTFDGSEPDETSLVYTSPIHINTTKCLRAKAFKADFLPDYTVTHSYLLNQSQYIKSLPVLSIVGDEEESLYEPDGIMAIVGGYYDNGWWTPIDVGDYNNPIHRGLAYERPVSVELINSGDNSGFQINCGIRVQGSNYHRPHYTRGDNWSTNYDKFSFKFFFRNIYSGTKELEYPIIPIVPFDYYDTLAIRGGHNDISNPFIKDELARRLQRDMGSVSSCGTFANLFINGDYKAYYNPCERLDAEFFKRWHDSDQDWDVITQRAVRNGEGTAWNSLIDYARTNDLADPIHYNEVGQRMDITQYIDYLILQIWTSNWDWPGNNWTVGRERSPEGKFTFHVWDAEGSFESWTVNLSAFDDYPSWWPIGLNAFDGPISWLYRALKANDDFKQLFSDRVYKHFYNDGALTNENITTRFNELYDVMSPLISGMSTYIRNGFISARRSYILPKFQEQDVYTFEGPTFNINGAYQHGGYADIGDTLSMTNSHGPGTIYYMLNGSDPRLNGIPGSVSTLVSENATKAVLIPTGPVSDDWKGENEPFDDSTWNDGTIIPDKTGGVGYDTDIAGGRPYAPYITVDVESQMYSYYTSCYIRIPFVISSVDPNDFDSLTLRMRYDDGFVAYINGHEVKRVNFTGPPLWNSAANPGHEDAGPESFDISGHIGVLQDGNNILAIHGLNVGTTSSDFLISVELNAGMSSIAGDGLSPDALNYTTTGPITLTKSTRIKARIKDGSQWSALNEATYGIGPVVDNLRITEIMYHPVDPNHEFIELKNIGSETINLHWVSFTDGIDFTFPSVEIDSYEHIVVVKDQAQFEVEYGPCVNIAGQYAGSLSNGGEDIKLEDAVGETILEFDYEDGWFDITDGRGFSLTVRDPNNTNPNDWPDKKTWRPSAAAGGSPGWDDAGDVPALGAVVINELLAHSHALDPDWIELYNTTGEPINIGGWFLSDSNKDDPNRMKYEIAEDTVIEPDGYVVFYEDQHFGDPEAAGCNEPFALSENGETLYLQSGQNGVLTGYYDEEKFDASETGVAFGRYYKASTDSFNFVAMSENTPGSTNAYPKVGPIVINEIMYHPRDPNTGSPFYDDDDFEYVELHNIKDEAVTLQEYDNELEIDVGWRFTDEDEAIDFVFPLGTTIPPHGYLVLVKDEDAFNYRYTVPGTVQILEWGDGKLNNGGEKVNLSKPGDMVGGTRYYIRVDRVNYSDGSHPVGEDPWPAEPDGTGQSLTRKVASDYGNDVANWQTALATPGSINP